jgi:hypothetical protein
MIVLVNATVAGTSVKSPPPRSMTPALPESVFAMIALSVRVRLGARPSPGLPFQIPRRSAEPSAPFAVSWLPITSVCSSDVLAKFATPPPPAIAVPPGAFDVPLFEAITLSRIVKVPSTSMAPPLSASALDVGGTVAVESL